VLAVSHHQIQIGESPQQRLPLALPQTTGHSQPQAGLPGLQRLQRPQAAVQLLLGLVSDAAAVQNDQVRFAFALSRNRRAPRGPRRIQLIDLPEGDTLSLGMDRIRKSGTNRRGAARLLGDRAPRY
jgi:hypothetical protein